MQIVNVKWILFHIYHFSFTKLYADLLFFCTVKNILN